MSVMRLVVLLFAIGLCGCSSFKKPSFIVDRETHYLSAKSIPPLKIPPGLSSHTIHSHYPVSERYYPDKSRCASVIPPGL